MFQLLSSPEARVWGTGSAEAGEKEEAEHNMGDWGCLRFGKGGKEHPHMQS